MPAGSIRRFYLVSAWSTRANQISALVAFAAVLGVMLLSRVPLAPGFEFDLREPDHFGGLRQLTLLEFSRPTRIGRIVRGRSARAVLNRPLPPSFTLTLEGRSLSGTRSPFQVIVGSSPYSTDFGRSDAIRTFAVDNPTGSREIVFRSPTPSQPLDLVIRRIGIE